ncbi:unnamed protein product [Orchesella dallaii]|uniref:C2 domain-containing protein n=1 Tax=Orchesella dallaii TaxID=48710 RepID=A0ABP1R1F1_9HEXA
MEEGSSQQSTKRGSPSPKKIKKQLIDDLSPGSATCQSQPASPSLSGRLGRVTRLISRSDANLVHAQSLKKRSRHDSGDSGGYDGDEGSPSKGIMARAAGYVTHLRSRLGKHRERARSGGSEPDQSNVGGYSQPLSCCGSKRHGDESVDTLAGIDPPGQSRLGSSVPSTGSATGDGSVSLNEQQSSEQKSENQSEPTNNKPVEEQTGMISPFPFHTLNVHLLRGKNLVAKDACGSSDPYVKVKIADKLHYKSKTIYRDLNPVWDESFVLPISDLTQPIVFKVFDYDWGFQDDFMGMTCLDASRLPPNKPTELTLTLSEIGTPGSESMGDIFINVTLVPRTIEEKDIWFSGEAPGGKLQDKSKMKSQIWSSVLTVLVLEADNLSPGDEKVYMDAFVKFRMGNQKFKTRTLQRVTSAKWLEQFDFYLYDGQPQVLEVQVFDESFSRDYIGRCAIDIGLLEKELTHHKVFQLQESPGEISLLLTISGLAGVESISDLTHHSISDDEMIEQYSRFSLRRSLNAIQDVGQLIVKVFEAQGLAAADIGGKSDPFVVLELVNSRLQTQTEYRTLTPVWNKIFTFAVKDITNVLEITVYDEDKNHSKEFLGKLDIPLWKIKNKEKRWYMLKDQKLLKPAKGNNAQILLEMELLWNPIRAGIRVMDPPENKFLQGDLKLKRETFLLNIDRLRKIGAYVYDVAQFIESCLMWEYPLRSVIALVLYEVICYTFEPFMIPCFLMLLILKQWIVCSLTGTPLLDEPDDDDVIVMDDDDDEKEDDDKKMSLRQKLQAVQDATQTVQNALGDIASICESTRNMFRMAVPFISWLAVLGLLIGTVLLYYIPLRYLAMGFGFHKFFRPIIRPNAVPTNEVYNLLLRVPDNPQLVQYRPLRVSAPAEQQRNRSPPAAPGSSGTKTPQTKKKYKFW